MEQNDVSKISMEYINILNSWKYPDNTEDAKLLSGIKKSDWLPHFIILHILFILSKTDKIPENIKKRLEEYYNAPYPNMTLQIWEIEVWFFYKSFNFISKELINNIVYNLFVRWSIKLNRLDKFISISELSKWKKYFSPEVHNFYSYDRINITENWRNDYNNLLSNSDNEVIKIYKNKSKFIIEKKSDLKIKEDGIYICNKFTWIKLWNFEEIILKSILNNKESSFKDINKDNDKIIFSIKKLRREKLSKIWVSIKTEKEKYSDNIRTYLIKKDTKEILK